MEEQRIPKVGDLVLYTLSGHDAGEINRRRHDAHRYHDIHRAQATGVQVHGGNEASAGQVMPATIVAVWGTSPTSCCNLQVQLDGTDTYWATSRSRGEGPQSWEYRDIERRLDGTQTIVREAFDRIATLERQTGLVAE